MELEDLKSIWKNSEFKPKDTAEIAAMLRGNSMSIIAKLKKSVWFELLLTVVAGVGLLIYALTLPSGALKWTSISILLLLVAYSFFYIKKIILLNQFNSNTENIRSNLETLHHNLSSYLKFYKRSYAILYPVYFVLGLMFGAIERGTSEFLDYLAQPRSIIYLVLTAGLFFFCSTWLTRWYLKKLYGNQIDKLQKLLHELQAEPTH
jgi:glucan phosphoethanolaminetransferase (alkaline phosphatase superfamily)